MAASASSTKAWAKGRGMKRTHVRVDPLLPAHAQSSTNDVTGQIAVGVALLGR
jgi:hypothetical protein